LTGWLTPALAAVTITGCGPDPRPNVILVSIDALRADHLGCYGYRRSTSPFLDRLAARGTLFENTLVQIPATLPSHMSIFTGLNPNEHGVLPPDGRLAAEIPTLPEMLRRAGYRTAGFTEGGYVSGSHGFDRGFDRFDDLVPKLSNDIEVVFSRGLEFIRAHHRGRRPLFVFLHTHAVHDPYLPPLPYTTLYLNQLDPTGSLLGEYPFFRFGELPLMTPKRAAEHQQIRRATEEILLRSLPPGVELPTGPALVAMIRDTSVDIPPETAAIYASLYDASINYADDVLRSFFGSLASMGLLDETVVIVTSDHGEEFLEHGMLTHEQIYHPCLHVPLIVVGKGIPAGRKVPEIVRSIDLTPTILALTGTPSPAPMSGVSLAPLINGSDEWIALESFARNHDNSMRSLHVLDRRLIQVVAQLPAEGAAGAWYDREAVFETDHTDIDFRAMSYHTPRDVELSIDGAHHSTVTVTEDWSDFSLILGGPARTRTFTLRTPDCDVPAEVEASSDHRCLSFRVAGFPHDTLELFDLTADPTGRTDISAEEADLAAALERRITTYDPLPETVE
jgi:arylsulfatase A-like enzyme